MFTNLPDLSGALTGWEQEVILVEVVKEQDENFINTVIKKETPFKAVVQPLSYKKGYEATANRTFEWIVIHLNAGSSVILKNNDRIKYNFKEYEIRSVLNYSNSSLQTNKSAYPNLNTYGYIEYEACEVNIDNDINHIIND